MKNKKAIVFFCLILSLFSFPVLAEEGQDKLLEKVTLVKFQEVLAESEEAFVSCKNKAKSECFTEEKRCITLKLYIVKKKKLEGMISEEEVKKRKTQLAKDHSDLKKRQEMDKLSKDLSKIL